MAKLKAGLKIKSLVKIALILGVVIVLFFVFHSKEKAGHTNTATTQTASPSLSSAKVQGSGFSYAVPKGWVKLDEPTLSNENANSGIARLSPPTVEFTIAVEPAITTPNSNELDPQVMAAIHQFPNFSLVSKVASTVAGVSGSKYTYTFGGQPETEQILTVLVYKKQAYSLLFTCPLAEFSSQEATFGQIIASFSFD